MKNNVAGIKKRNIIDDNVQQFVTLVALISPFFFYLPNFIFSPSIGTFGLCLAGIVFGIMYSIVLFGHLSNKKQKELLTGYLNRFPECSFNKFPLNQFSYGSSSIEVEAHSMKIVDYSNIQLRDSSDRKIEIYVVKRGQSNIVPNQMVAFQAGIFSSSYIFVRDEPEKANSLGRFFIFHEIGHSSYINALRKDVAHSLWLLFVPPIILGLINLPLNLFSVGAICIYFILLMAIKPKYKSILQSDTLFDELTADLFALQFLSEKDKIELTKYMEKSGNLLLHNSFMTDSQNLSRLNAFLYMIKNPQDPFGKNVFSFHGVNLFQTFLPLSIFIPIMGYVINVTQASDNLICGKPIALFVCLLIAIFVVINENSEGEKKIRNTLSKEHI